MRSIPKSEIAGAIGNSVRRVFSEGEFESSGRQKSRKYSLGTIERVTRKIVHAVHPRKVVLFGSYAYGQPNQDSDVDLLVIHDAPSREDRRDVYRQASAAVYPRPFPIDIVVRSMEQVRSRPEKGDFFLKEILKKGHVLYER